MGFPIQWLESQQRFDWTEPIPLDGTAKTLLIYIQELLDAIDYRNNEIGKDYQLPPFYYHEKFRKWFYEEMQKEIDKLIIEFGYASVEDSNLLGRPWSELPQRTNHGTIKYEWDYSLLNDFREVLDKLKFLLYGNIYVTDSNSPNLRIVSMNEVIGDLEFIKSFPIDQYSIMNTVDEEYAYGKLSPTNRTWKKNRSTWATVATRINVTEPADMCVDENYLYQLRKSQTWIGRDILDVLNKEDLSLISSKNLQDYKTCPPIPPGTCFDHDFRFIACDLNYLYITGETHDISLATVRKIYKIIKSDLSLANYFSVVSGLGYSVRGVSGICVDDKYLYTTILAWAAIPGFTSWLQKYNKSTGALVTEIQIDLRCVIACDDKYLYIGGETYVSPIYYPVRMRNKDLSLVRTIDEMDEIKFLWTGSGICTEFEYLNAV